MLNRKIPSWFHKDPETRPDLRHILVAATGSFAGIALTAYISLQQQIGILIPSLGASAVLLFGASHVPMARPRNVFWGHVVSASVGVVVYHVWGMSWWSLAVGISMAILLMLVTDTLHPPGGATAFTAIFTHQDFAFVLKPVGLGVICLLVVAWILHQLAMTKPQT